MSVQHSASSAQYDHEHTGVWREDQKPPIHPMTSPRIPKPQLNVTYSKKTNKTEKEEKWAITGSSGPSDECPWLNLVPRVFASHTSNPLSAKTNARELSGGSINHVAASFPSHKFCKNQSTSSSFSHQNLQARNIKWH